MRFTIPIVLLALAFTSCSGESPERTPQRKSDVIKPQSEEMSDSTIGTDLLQATNPEQRREELMRQGRYDCCTKPGCTECISDLDSCGCYMAIKQKDPICGECLKGYREGHGKLKLVSIVELEKITNRVGLERVKR